jgi:hypothetical protein
MRMLLVLLIFAACKSGKPAGDPPEKCYSGKLMVKGICGQRVVTVLEPLQEESLLIRKIWIHPDNGDTLVNVFSVDNTCDFPAAIDSGAVFRFKLGTANKNDCIQCMAYTPVPEEKNVIVVCDNSKE